jgi:hypothetical protein
VVLNLVVQVNDETTETCYVVACQGAINFWSAISLGGTHEPATVCNAVTEELHSIPFVLQDRQHNSQPRASSRRFP